MAAFKPMLSATCEDITTLRYPVLVSPKLDGIRCIIHGGQAVSRNLKPIPNLYIQSRLKGLPDGLDGELIVGKPTGDDVWNRSQSGVMSADGEPEFTFWVFDRVDETASFHARLACAASLIEACESVDNAKVVRHHNVRSAEDLDELEDAMVEEGFEGVMIRDPNGLYKYGRSTLKEGGLAKLKRWHDAEAIVVDMVERMHNENEATKDELGRTKRTTHKANKTGRGDLGALVCEFAPTANMSIAQAPYAMFEIGTGFTDLQRKEIWASGGNTVGRIVTFKYQSLSPEGIPRFPVFKGFRDQRDMSQMSAVWSGLARAYVGRRAG